MADDAVHGVRGGSVVERVGGQREETGGGEHDARDGKGRVLVEDLLGAGPEVGEEARRRHGEESAAAGQGSTGKNRTASRGNHTPREGMLRVTGKKQML